MSVSNCSAITAVAVQCNGTVVWILWLSIICMINCGIKLYFGHNNSGDCIVKVWNCRDAASLGCSNKSWFLVSHEFCVRVVTVRGVCTEMMSSFLNFSFWLKWAVYNILLLVPYVLSWFEWFLFTRVKSNPLSKLKASNPMSIIVYEQAIAWYETIPANPIFFSYPLAISVWVKRKRSDFSLDLIIWSRKLSFIA